jgi:hypothetical protein
MSDPVIDLLVAHGYKYNPEAGSWSKEGEKPAPVQEPVAQDLNWLPAHIITASGMTLRDYFAAKAMQGLLAGTKTGSATVLATDSYKMADAMLKAREV